jgi:hypothetical protein
MFRDAIRNFGQKEVVPVMEEARGKRASSEAASLKKQENKASVPAVSLSLVAGR